MHAGTAQLDVDGLGKRLDERLRGVVGSHVGAGHEARHGRDVENAAAFALRHVGRELAHKLDEREVVRQDERPLASHVAFHETRVVAEARVVHEHIDGKPHLAHAGGNFRRRAHLREVAHDDVGRYVVFEFQLRRRADETLLVAADEHHVHPSRRALPRKLEPQTACAACDERCFPILGPHSSQPFSPSRLRPSAM